MRLVINKEASSSLVSDDLDLLAVVPLRGTRNRGLTGTVVILRHSALICKLNRHKIITNSEIKSLAAVDVKFTSVYWSLVLVLQFKFPI